MTSIRWRQIFDYLVAVIWLINGVWCKILNQVQRHDSIVKKLIAPIYYRDFTLVIYFGNIAGIVVNKRIV